MVAGSKEGHKYPNPLFQPGYLRQDEAFYKADYIRKQKVCDKQDASEHYPIGNFTKIVAVVIDNKIAITLIKKK